MIRRFPQLILGRDFINCWESEFLAISVIVSQREINITEFAFFLLTCVKAALA